MKRDETELTEFQIIWCIVVAIALVTLLLDLFKWRPN
jgi:hypothetical protein